MQKQENLSADLLNCVGSGVHNNFKNHCFCAPDLVTLTVDFSKRAFEFC